MGGGRPLARATLVSRMLSLVMRVGGDYRDNSGCQNSEVGYAGEATDSASDLERGELGCYGADIEVGDYLLNREGTFDYEEIIGRCPNRSLLNVGFGLRA